MAKQTRSTAIDAALRNFDLLPDSAGVRAPVVRALNGNISNATLYRWVKRGILPAPTKAGPRTSIWNVGALRARQARQQAV
ncbi:MAG: transcriptional regulator [Nevskia sp.]|nr:transcriptional regulator [Nevskia sp.]